MSSDLRQVRSTLHELATPIAGGMRRERRRRAVVQALNAARWSLLAVPLAYLALVAIAALAGADARLPWLVVVPIWLLVPAALVLQQALRAGRAPVTDIGALARIDRELHLGDRLSAAREFVDASAPDGFMQAAIRDAERRVERARAARPAATEAPPRLRAGPLGHAVLGLLVLWTAGRFAGAGGGAGAGPEQTWRVAAGPGATEPPPVVAPTRPQQRPTTPRAEPRPSEPQTADETAADDSNPSQQTRRGRNPRGAGRSAQARASAGGGSERGQPSNQAQSTKGRDASKPVANKPKPPKDGEDKEQPTPPKPEQQSGATQGRGSGRGSSRSPMATPWSSKDQVVSDEQEELEDDEEVDDENDESDARGGLQPNLRQRKPPVNRDLQIAMGGGPPNEDANGRGGPGGPKKQRGVAQLVLGVTFPDHVTSPPNPGMSKVTQERIEPQPQQSDGIAGEDRGRRDAPMGHLSRRVLSPWMQDLVRKFYLSLRDNRRTE